MEKVQKPSISECCMPLSEPFTIYIVAKFGIWHALSVKRVMSTMFYADKINSEVCKADTANGHQPTVFDLVPVSQQPTQQVCSQKDNVMPLFTYTMYVFTV
jgi:hypothetical protein